MSLLSQKSFPWLCLLTLQLHGCIQDAIVEVLFPLCDSEYVTSFLSSTRTQAWEESLESPDAQTSSSRTHTSSNLFWKWTKFPFETSQFSFSNNPHSSPVYPVPCTFQNACVNSQSFLHHQESLTPHQFNHSTEIQKQEIYCFFYQESNQLGLACSRC